MAILLISPRKTALYQTLEKSPKVTSPTTTAPRAIYVPSPSRGRWRKKVSSRFSTSSTRSVLTCNEPADKAEKSEAWRKGAGQKSYLNLNSFLFALFALAWLCTIVHNTPMPNEYAGLEKQRSHILEQMAALDRIERGRLSEQFLQCHGRDGTRSKAAIRNSIFFSPVFFSRFL